MTPLAEHLHNSARVVWHISLWCNYSCDYCGVLVFRKRSGKPQAHAFDHYPASKWVELFSSFPQQHVQLHITGGEPFLDRKNLLEVASGLAAMERWRMLRIDTNGTWDPDYFRSLDKGKIRLNVSYHPPQVDFEVFLRRILAIRAAGFRVAMINYVLAPENLEGSEAAIRRLEKEKFFVNVAPMLPGGVYLSRKERSLRELEILEEHNTPLDLHFRIVDPPTRGRPCFHPALSYYLTYDGRIRVACTGEFQNAFEDGIPELRREAAPCPLERCEGCMEMYRSLADEPRVKTPLGLYSLDEYAREVQAYRKTRRWKRRLGLAKRSDFRSLLAARKAPAAALIRPESIRLAVPDLAVFGFIDTGNGEALIEARGGDRVLVAGWAASNRHGAPVKELRLFINGRPVGQVRDFHSRPDVAAAFGRPDLEDSGWRTMVYLPVLPEGEYTLEAKAIAPDGETGDLPALRLRIME